VPFDEMFGIGAEDSTGFNSILDTAYLTKEWSLPEKQVLLTGDGHWWISLDYRQGATPTVAWIDVEEGDELQLAGSFREFLDGLLPGSCVDGATARLKKPLG
jgi:hypothetical protein